MPDYRIEVIVDPSRAVTGSRAVRGELQKTEATAARLQSTIAKAFGVIGAAALLRELASLTSAWTDLNSRILLATGSQEAAEEGMARLSEIARRTYSDLQLTAESFLLNSTAMTELGYSTQDQLDYTEALNNALVVSGAKAERARQVTEALAKAMAFGALRGDELNTVIQVGGRVASALAAGLGVTTNELRTLGREGKITADSAIQALISQMGMLREEAEAMPATVGDAFVLLKNATLEYVGTVDKAVGSSAFLSSALIKVADNLDDIVSVGTKAAVTFAAFKLAPLAKDAIDSAVAFVKLRTALLTGTAVQLGSAEAARQQAAAEVESAAATAAKTAANLAQIESEKAKALVVAGSAETTFIQAAVEQQVAAAQLAHTQAANALTAAQTRLATATKAATIQSRVLAAINPFAVATVGAAALGFAIKALLDDLAETQEGLLKINEQGANFGLTEFEKAEALADRLTSKLVQLEVQQRNGTNSSSALATQIENLRARLHDANTAVELLRSGQSRTTAQAKEQIAALKELAIAQQAVVEGIRQENELLQFSAREREIQSALLREVAKLEKDGAPKLTPEQKEEIKLELQRNQALRDQAEILDRLHGPQEDFQAQIGALRTLLDDDKISMEEFNAELLRLAVGADNVDLSALGIDKLGLDVDGFDLDKFQALLAAARGGAGAGGPEGVGTGVFGPPQPEGPTGAQPLPETGGLSPELQLQQQLLESIKGPAVQYAAVQEQLGQLFHDNKISAEEYTIAMNEAAIATNTLSTSASQGLTAGLAAIENQILDISGTVANTLVGGFQEATSALVDFVRTGEADFSHFFDVILDGLAKLLVQQALTGLLGLGGGGGGGLGGVFSGLFGGGKAVGGNVAPGQSYPVGEHGPELFTPTSAGKITPAGETAAQFAGGAQQQPQVNVSVPPAQVVVVDDPKKAIAAMKTPEGEGVIVSTMEKRGRSKGAYR